VSRKRGGVLPNAFEAEASEPRNGWEHGNLDGYGKKKTGLKRCAFRSSKKKGRVREWITSLQKGGKRSGSY